MTNSKRTKSIKRPTTKNRNKGLLHAGITLISAVLVGLTERSNAALSTTCSSGEYLILDTDTYTMEGVCATCPRGKLINHNIVVSSSIRVLLSPPQKTSTI